MKVDISDLKTGKPLSGEEMVRAADEIAERAHAGQVDKAGDPYISHPRAVAAQLDTPEARTVGLLHDVVEDTEITLEDLEEIFPREVTDAVALMTHPEGMPYLDYVRRLSKNPLAREVKLADLTHNMDLSRIAHVTQKDLDRVEQKYRPAYALLKAASEGREEQV